MSLHFLGIRDFPILHQQLTSPSAKSAKPPPSQDHTEELVQDSKDVLIQRLLDLATHLQEEGIRDGEVSRLHHDVDHMERTLHQSPLLLQEPDFQGHRSTRSFDSSRSEEDRLWGPLSPGLRSPIRFFESPRAPSNPTSAAKGISPKKAALLAEEADALLTQLTRTVGELRQRREESEHIHDLLVTRAEKAAQRVIELEERIADLDADFDTNQSELNFLRLQLRALEVQGLEYMQFNADDELTQSIRNWKKDWADVDQRTKAKRKRLQGRDVKE